MWQFCRKGEGRRDFVRTASPKRHENFLAEGVSEVVFRDRLGDLLGDFRIDDREGDEGTL
jgi:hypothetical protein